MSEKTSVAKIFFNGFWKDNPNLVQLLGMCPMLAVTNQVANAIGMGAAILFVLVCSALIISLLRKVIPNQVRIAVYVVIIAAFVTMADLFLAAFFPALSKELGPFVPLIVVNCIILGRMEAFAAKNAVGPSLVDAAGMSIGYTIIMLIMGTVREILGNGTWMGIRLYSESASMLVFVLPAGAFFTLGTLIGVSKFLQKKLAK